MKLVAAAAIVLLLTNCSTSYTCEDFREGTYRFAEEDFKDVTITRTADEQIEKSVSKDLVYTDVYEIIWSGKCTYQLVLKSTDNIDRMPFSKFDTISAHIVEIVDDGYYFETEIFDERPRGHLIKVD